MLAVEARGAALKREAEERKRLAWNTAALAGLAYHGKLKSFEECFAQPGKSNGGAALLSALFKMKSRGVAMTVEKISLH